MPLLLAFAGCFGLALGSFLNVVAYRVPAGLSVISPPSACPRCNEFISSRDNIPLVSWVLLRAACRHCKAPISIRYPLVEAVTGAVFLVVSIRFGSAFLQQFASSPQAVVAAGLEWSAFLYFGAVAVALAVIDLDVRRLPDRIVLPAYAVGVVLLGGADIVRGDSVALGVAAAGAGAAALLYAVLWFVKPGGMGLGDVKLAGVIGLFLGQLGVEQLVVGLASAFVMGGVFGLVLMILGRAGRKTAVPFGPWMLAGAGVGVLAGPLIATWYLGITGLA